jgi:hypothetical protein
VLAFYLILPALPLSAACVGAQSARSWDLYDPNTIILADFSKPIAALYLPWCTVFQFADIGLTGDMLCDGDKIWVDDALCEIRKVQPLAPDGAPPKLGRTPLPMHTSPEFTIEQFGDGLTAKALYERAARDGYVVEPAIADSGPVERLNQLLSVPNFYDISRRRYPSAESSDYMRQLIKSSEGYRRKHFSDLRNDQKVVIRKLNRMVIESIYAGTCPRIFLETAGASP